MKKKFFVTVTAVFGAFLGAMCMAACNKDKGNGGDEPDGPDEPTGVTYTVVFDANGGKFDAEFEIDGEVIDDGAVISSDGKTATYTVTSKELDEPLRLPERAQYAFSGWAKDTDGEVLWNFESDELDGDTTLYAVWATSFDFVRTDDGSGYIVRGIGGLSGDVEVPETHNGKPVTGIAKDAFKNSRSLTGIIIPDSVTEIGTGAFKNATKLESATIGEGITEIPSEAFCDCSALVELGLPKSLEKIEYDAFGTDGTRSLLEVKYAGSIDDWCGIDMDCSSDKKANPLSNGKAELYVNGRAVSEITINAETVNRWAFYGCKTIDSVTVGKNVKTIGEKAFYQSEIEQLTFAQGSTLESIGASAFETNHMTTLTLPDSPVVLGESAFKDCNRLTALDLGGAVVLNDHAFDNCFMLSNINMRTVEYLGAGAFAGNSVLNEDGALSSVTIPATAWYIGNGCFGSQPALSSVTVSGSAATAKWQVTALQGGTETVSGDVLSDSAQMANRLKKSGTWVRLLGDLTKSGDTVTGVTSEARQNGIGKLVVGGAGITKIAANAFKDLKGLRTLSIASNDISEIGSGFVDGCDGLTEITVATGNTTFASASGMLFEINGKIIWINPTIGSDWTSGDVRIPSGVKRIPQGLFSGRAVWHVEIPASVTELDDGAFDGCPIELAEVPAVAVPYIVNDRLRSVDVTGGTTIEAGAFAGCDSLTFVGLPDSLTTIGARAFENCGGLTKVTIPNKVTSISENAFAGCAIVLETEKTKAECAWSYDGVPVVYDSRNNDVADDGYVYAAIDGLRYALKDGKATVAKQSSTLTAVNIPASVEYKDTTYEVTGIADGAFDGCEIDRISVASGNSSISVYKGILYNADRTEITLVPKGLKGSVTLADTLKSIPESAFAGMTGITKITIPDSVTSIGAGAFSGCDRSLFIYCEAESKPYDWNGDWNSSCRVVWDCKNNDKDGNGYVYAVIGGMRYALKDGEATVISQPVNISAVNMLETVTYKNETYRVTSIDGDAFEGCNNLTFNESEDAYYLGNEGNRYFALIKAKSTSITVCEIPASTKIIASSAFDNCSSLNEIRYAGDMKGWCGLSGLKHLMESVTNSKKLYIGDMEITGEIVIPENVTTINSYAFYGCQSLTGVTVPDSVTSMGVSVFQNCGSLTVYCETAAKPDGWKDSFKPVVWDCKNNDKDEDGYAYAVINGLRYSLKDGEAAVINQPSDISGNVTIPATVTYKNMSYNVKSIETSAFAGCNDITNITIQNGVTSIWHYAFSGCNGLTSVTIPDSVTYIGDSAFDYCYNLQFNEYGNAYYLGNGTNPYSALIKIISNPSVTSLVTHTDTKVIARSAFATGHYLTDITICGDVKEFEYDFSKCTKLVNIKVPDSVISINSQSFKYCRKLQYNEYDNAYYLGNDSNPYLVLIKAKDTSITSCIVRENTKVIAGSAFWGCYDCTSITIPNSVTRIDSGAFTECKVTDITFNGTKAQWNNISKGSNWYGQNEARITIHCTDGDITKS